MRYPSTRTALGLLRTQEKRCKQPQTDRDGGRVSWWLFRDDIDALTTQLRLVLVRGVKDLRRGDSKVRTDVSQLRQVEHGLTRLQARVGRLGQSNGLSQCTLLEAKLLSPVGQQPTDQRRIGDDGLWRRG